MVWVWCVCFCSVLGIRWQLVFLAHCTVQMLLQLTTRATYMYWSVFQTVFDVVIKRHACVCVCALVFMLICCTCLEFCHPAVCMHVHKCVWMCVCVCMYILLNICCLKGIWGVGELTAVCVWSCLILIWCTCTEFCYPAQYCSKVLH